ncbi:MAG: serine/threonine protein kinase [Myxococcales bacterium]|nr:serine/threonine protein kinase [Myxococcales bacterium]MCB9736070.1 serine/threonine protein kinase [Deltaproteobacteria bacterium]
MWEARDDARDGALVAVKLLHRPTSVAATRFLRGADLASRLDHPNIVPVHAYGETDGGDAWVAMARVAGAPLDAATRHRPIPWARALGLMDQLLAALAATHAAGVVHRDVKPGNCFVVEGSPRARLLLGDYGLATVAERGALEVIPAPGSGGAPIRGVCGTPEYLAPEQILGARLDGRADVYAAAITLYRLIAGTPPFAGPDRGALYLAHLGEARPRVEAPAGLPRVPARLADIVARGMARDPRDRWESAETMRLALGTVPTPA